MLHLRSRTPLLALACSAASLAALSLGASAQAPVSNTQLYDFHTDPPFWSPSSTPWPIDRSGAEVVFSAELPGLGRTPWITDGTPAGTRPLLGLGDAPVLSETYGGITLSNGKTVFAGVDTESDADLFVTGPGTSGLEVLAAAAPDGDPSEYRFAEWQGEAWIAVYVPQQGTTIWRTDGTAAGTQPVAEIPAAAGSFTKVEQLEVASDKLFLHRVESTPGSFFASNSLWMFASPAALPGLIFPLPSGLGAPAVQMDVVGDALVFAASIPTSGIELWRTDGTPGGTAMLVDASPGSGDSSPKILPGASSTELYFTAYEASIGREFWRTDGTVAGTHFVVDLNPGPADGDQAFPGGAFLGGSYVFTGRTNAAGAEPWITDGTAAGTLPLGDLNAGSGNSLAREYTLVGNQLLFLARSNQLGEGLWRTDGTPQGTSILQVFASYSTINVPGSPFLGVTPAGAVVLGDDLVHGREPWISDGTLAGTQLLADLAPAQTSEGGFGGEAVPFQDRLVLEARTKNEGGEPWVTDGTAAGTLPLGDFIPGYEDSRPVFLGELGGRVAFLAQTSGDPQSPLTLFATDATPAGTQVVQQIPGEGAGGPIRVGAVWQGQRYFSSVQSKPNKIVPFSTWALWRTDGTLVGTEKLSGVIDSVNGALPLEASVPAGFLFDGDRNDGAGRELWRSDGTALGTLRVTDLYPGAGDSRPHAVTQFGSTVLFAAYDSATSRNLYASNGTPAGTELLAPLPFLSPQETQSNPPAALPVLGGLALFANEDVANGRELWVTDGTAAGTQLLVDLVTGPDGSFPVQFERAGEAVFFFAAGGLWKCDGTVGGTTLVQTELAAQANFLSAHPMHAVGSGETVAFRAWSAASGIELWVSDGTALGTRQLAESAPGTAHGLPAFVQRLGDQLLFSAEDGLNGAELHAVPLVASGAFALEPFGQACGAAIGATGEARIGATFQVEVDAGAANAPVLFFLGVERAWIPLGADCSLHLASPLFLAGATANGSGEAGLGFGLPNDSALAGVEFALQAAAVVVGGPLQGFLNLTEGLEVVVGP